MSREFNPTLEQGRASPLGVSKLNEGLNFSLFSEHASGVTLCLFTPGSQHSFLEIPLDPHQNRTGNIWHILVIGLPETPLEYGYRLQGPTEDPKLKYDPKKILSDPYAKGLATSCQWGHKGWDEDVNIPRGRILLSTPFNWEKERFPKIPHEELIIYEMQVRSFTQESSSKVKHPGTFLGVIEKIPYLKSLGINAVELMPIFEFDECEIKQKNPKTGSILKNVWGYSTINFFAPMNRFGSSDAWTSAMDDFRTLVKELHKNGIEVILDVVYNHTAEGNESGPYFSFKGIDNEVYYMLNPKGEYYNFSGTGNTFNCNHPVVSQLIVDSLRYWVDVMHVDGFRFDLASILTRAENGAPLAAPPVIEAILNDPILADVKLIAEAWDAGGLYQVGSFPSGGRWHEWNGKYRDAVRKFMKGTDGLSGEFSQAISGSQHIYGHDRLPYHSINFVTAHDGYSLKDLVSYMEKHNLENGEDNRDGANDNESWNCGAEAETSNRKIIQLREQQMRNFHACLMLSIGTPMILMGDEYGHTRLGNNNTWCQDNALNWFQWDLIEKNKGFFRFFCLMIAFRKNHSLLKRRTYLTDQDVDWHGYVPLKANWGHENRFVAYTLKNHETQEDLYVAFNAQHIPAHIQIPSPPQGKKWYRIVDTSLPSPNDFLEDPKSESPLKYTYDLKEHSTLILKAF